MRRKINKQHKMGVGGESGVNLNEYHWNHLRLRVRIIDWIFTSTCVRRRRIRPGGRRRSRVKNIALYGGSYLGVGSLLFFSFSGLLFFIVDDPRRDRCCAAGSASASVRRLCWQVTKALSTAKSDQRLGQWLSNVYAVEEGTTTYHRPSSRTTQTSTSYSEYAHVGIAYSTWKNCKFFL